MREEFALDVPSTRQALAQACAQPAQAAELLEPSVGFIGRSVQAGALMGLHGFGGYLQQIAEFTESQIKQPNPASLAWLSGWLDPALAYLEAPAAPSSTQAVMDFLRQCPQQPDEDALHVLHTLLSTAPELDATEAAAAAQPLPEATLEDIGLSTEDVDASLLSAMLVDAPEQLEKLGNTLERMASGLASMPELTEALRTAHTFKGSGNIIGLPGVARIAHRLEDTMEWAIELIADGEKVNPTVIRDMLAAVQTLQHMVAHLQGEEAAPTHALPVLQRLLDWVTWIRDGSADTVQPDALMAVQGSTQQADAPEASSAQAAPTDAQTLRVGVDRLSRVLRRAGQSIVSGQRLEQLMRNTEDRLQALETNHIELARRLRDLEQTVDKQVVQLREQKDGGEQIDPLEMDRYDALHGISRFVAEAVQDELELAREARAQANLALKVLRDEGYSLREQHRELLAARLVPVKSILPRLKRNVAQTASTTGKSAVLEVVGDATTMDADVLNRLTEPLLHLLRNAVDHGIESPDERVMIGKNAQGMVRLEFRRVGQEVQVICNDNGRGLDLPTIYDKAVEYGLIAPGAKLAEDELRRLILRPGFSTKGHVTEVSGRGVGMDVVNDRITALKGRLDIDSTPFGGTTITLHVPVSTGAAQALIVQCAGEQVALSSDQVVTALAADQCEVTSNDAGLPMLRYADAVYPLYALGVWIGFEDPAPIVSRTKPAVLVQGLSGTIALMVDAVVDARELILQDIGRLARRISGVVGGAMRGDGKPMFLLDVPSLERATKSSLLTGASLAMRKRLTIKKTRILVVDDALSVRRSMEQLLGDAGYEVTTANDGFLALDSMRENLPAILLTDLEMPNLNGLELTKRVREVPQWMGLPVIMITSRATEKHRDMAMAAGVDLYLTKPYTDAALLENVRALTAQDASSLLG